MSCDSTDPPAYCAGESAELNLYQAFIFSVPIFFTLVLLFVFYLFYLRRRRANWQSVRLRAAQLSRGENPAARPSESGIKKEVRELLPVVVFKESFLIRETQCSVCLGDYQSDERLQRIPPCGHTFHVDCIDHWLSTNTTCPLCRVSLLPASKAVADPLNNEGQAIREEESEQQSLENSEGRVVRREEVDEERDQCNESPGLVRTEVEGSGNDVGQSIVIDVEAQGSPEGNIRS